VEKASMAGFWLRLGGIVTGVSLALMLTAALVGHGMEKRVLALLSAPAQKFWQINLLDVNRGLQHPLTRDNNRYGFMWSPDGQAIGFSSTSTGFTVMDWTGRNRRPMTDSDGWMRWFAQGRSNFDSEWNTAKTERVFSRRYEIYICDAACTHDQNITNEGGYGGYYDTTPAWSPDGQRILFTSDRAGLILEVFVMNRDGSGVQQLTFNSRMHNWNPDWSPDGRQIAFVENVGAAGEVFVMDADGSHIRRITFNPMNDTYPAWQP
jgi:Tol biopolymer transport system component